MTENQDKTREELIKELRELQQQYDFLKKTSEKDISAYKQTEAKLKISEMQKNAILNGITTNIAFVDKDLKIIWANKTAAESVNKSLDEMTGHTCHNFWADPLKPCVNCPSIKALETKQSEHIIIETPDGRVWNERGEPVSDEEGNLIGIVEIATDITQSVRKEKILHDNEARLYSLFVFSPISIWEEDFSAVKNYFNQLRHDGITDFKTFFKNNPNIVNTVAGLVKILDINQTSASLFDLTSKFDILNNFSLYFNADAIDVFSNELIALSEGQTHFESEIPFVTTRGIKKYFLLNLSVLPGYENTLSKVIVSFIDITKRKRIEKALILSEEKYRQLIDNSHDIIYTLTPEGVFIFASQAWTALLGHPVSEIVGQPFQKFVYEDDISKCFAFLNKVIETGQRYEGVEYRVRHANGTWRCHTSSAVPLRDENGKVIGFEGIARDITTRKLAEEEIIQKNQELQTLNAEKDKFFSIIAHDLRNPLGGFMNLTELMVTEIEYFTPEQKKDIILNLSHSASNIFNLLENLLEWSQMKQGLIPYDPQTIKLFPLVDESIKIVMESFTKKEIEIIYAISDDLTVFADSNMLKTIIRNLISNALKFTNKGGKIFFTAKVTAEQIVKISIKDTGIGMSQALIDNIFRIDVKTNRTGTEKELSTGLGLLLCKEFIEKHGGKIWAESNFDKYFKEKQLVNKNKIIGSSFYFTLPNKVQSEKEKATAAHKDDNEYKNLKILIAEDDKISELFIKRLVEKYSKEILIARNGINAVEACRNNPDIDLILMDIQMPEMDGYEATREIRQFNAKVVIIAQTAFALIGSQRKALEAGCTDFITKPINKNILDEVIKKHVKILKMVNKI